jgi:hypothetical protein
VVEDDLRVRTILSLANATLGVLPPVCAST